MIKTYKVQEIVGINDHPLSEEKRDPQEKKTIVGG